MISELSGSDFNRILEIVNDAAEAYKGVIPDDRWHDPYMSEDELREEIDSGVRFYGWIENGDLMGVMGIQTVKDATLIRHAYVLTRHQRRGIGSKLLEHLIGLEETSKLLVGTWKDAVWAISFYEKHAFRLMSFEEKDRLLREYWDIPERQIETSVVLKLET